MAISKELFLAILSMDAYNRGYGAGIADGQGSVNSDGSDADGLGEIKNVSKVGQATVSYTIADADLSDDAQAAGFYAIAYQIGTDERAPTDLRGTTIISYRGTDNTEFLSWSSEEGSDIWNSYAQGGGAPVTEASALASQFWRAVSEGTEEEVLLTGHSMGGGLAGVRP